MKTKTTAEIKARLEKDNAQFLKDTKEHIKRLVAGITGGRDILLDVSALPRTYVKVAAGKDLMDFDDEPVKEYLPMIHIYPDGETVDVKSRDGQGEIETKVDELSEGDIFCLLEMLELRFRQKAEGVIRVTPCDDSQVAHLEYTAGS